MVDADGICEYMNPIQRRADGFTRIPVEGQHITSLYVPHELEVIPTMECLQTGKPLLKKAYWYATSTNFLASTVTDFFPLFDQGRRHRLHHLDGQHRPRFGVAPPPQALQRGHALQLLHLLQHRGPGRSPAGMHP